MNSSKTPPPEPAKASTILTGVSGEYFVAAELSRRGYVASLTLRNTRGIDVLVANGDASRSVGIQVKSRRGKGKAWVLNEKAETYVAKNLFYVFVALGADLPAFHVVPSRIVSGSIRSLHKKWLATPGKRGQPHRDNPMRTFRDSANEYLGRWDLLGLDVM
jgi:hypothetical protein